MSDPGQQMAARAALADACRTEGCDVRSVTVLQVLRRRRANTREPFYLVTLQLATGTRLRYVVCRDGQRVEPGAGAFQTAVR